MHDDPRRPLARAGRVVVILTVLTITAVTGCATYVRPVAVPRDPQIVFIANYGKHSSILLPLTDAPGGDVTDDQRYVEYAFGDWDAFVDNRNTLLSYLRAGVASRGSALGRRHVTIDLRRSDADLADSLKTCRLLRFDAPRLALEALGQRLDEQYASSPTPPAENRFVRLSFVRGPERYWLLNNCNHLTARWARALGARVRGLAITSDFVLQPPRQPR